MSAGLVTCEPDGRTVLTLSMAFPLVHAYSTAGQHLWTTEIEGMRMEQVLLTATDGGQQAVERRHQGEFDRISSLVAIGQGHAMLQFVRLRPGVRGRVGRSVHSVLLSTADGHGVYLGTSIPLILGGNEPLLFAVDVNDLRTVTILEVRSRL